ncbi:MAG: hypothetical protein KTR15_04390 [Phycisphaeraceae bacterium]|nr:hypothetical protein [Phycisphaeraceae bacterium]
MELENLARWGQALARELGPSAIQQHGFYTLRRQADLDAQVGLVKQLEDAMDAVYGEQTAELPVLPSLHADD